MQVNQFIFKPKEGWSQIYGDAFSPELILAFGSGLDCSGETIVSWWKNNYPNASLLGCSTAGEISGTEVNINTIVATGICFEHTPFELVSIDFNEGDDSQQIGAELAKLLPHADLKHCLVISDGLNINGTKLLQGLEEILPSNINITGGLAGDGKRFESTQVCVGESYGPNKVALLGLYGENIDVKFGCIGGWDAFGPNRIVTESTDNVLYKVDGKSALTLYKEYLGEYANELPSSGLLFPLKVTTPDGKEFVRTLLGVDEENDCMTFAGDIPQGSQAKLMRANFDRLIDGASDAASHSIKHANNNTPDLAILISCVGRRLVLGQRVEEEIEAVSEVFDDATPITGFYSYGEICPALDEVACTLHNQTMTITTLTET